MPTFNENVVVNGRIGILSTNPAGKMEIKSPWGDWLFLRQDRDTQGGGFHIHNPWGNSNQPQGDPSRNRLEIGYHSSNGTDAWGQFVIQGLTGNVGIGTVQPTEKLHVNGNIRVSGDIFLGNADCAEEFAVENLSIAEPGMVMVMKDDETVCPSEKPYDRTAIGIVSGAGHYKPGIILNKRDDGVHRVPIAMMGRVLCKVDPKYGTIGRGDLLTTSPTLGHAMKAEDPGKAFGSVIGKALMPASIGPSLIPVIVSLQ